MGDNIKDGLSQIGEYISKSAQLPIKTYLKGLVKLLEDGNSPNMKTKNGVGMIDPVVKLEDKFIPTIKTLVLYGFDINAFYPDDYCTLLCGLIVKKRPIEMIQYVLSKGANPNEPKFKPPLFYAIGTKKEYYIRLLMAYKANPNVKIYRDYSRYKTEVVAPSTEKTRRTALYLYSKTKRHDTERFPLVLDVVAKRLQIHPEEKSYQCVKLLAENVETVNWDVVLRKRKVEINPQEDFDFISVEEFGKRFPQSQFCNYTDDGEHTIHNNSIPSLIKSGKNPYTSKAISKENIGKLFEQLDYVPYTLLTNPKETVFENHEPAEVSSEDYIEYLKDILTSINPYLDLSLAKKWPEIAQRHFMAELANNSPRAVWDRANFDIQSVMVTRNIIHIYRFVVRMLHWAPQMQTIIISAVMRLNIVYTELSSVIEAGGGAADMNALSQRLTPYFIGEQPYLRSLLTEWYYNIKS